MKKTSILLFVLLLGSSLLFAQQQQINRANRAYTEYSFKLAQDIYEKLVASGVRDADIYKRLGNTYYFNAAYAEAAKWYGELVEQFEAETGADYYFRYAQALRSTGNDALADTMMERFAAQSRAMADARAALYEADRDYMAEIEAHSDRYDTLDFAHNSQYSDFAPAFYKGGLLFSSDRDTGNLARYRHTWNQRDFLDLYQVNADSATVQKPMKVAGVNTRYHESTSALSPDGNTLYFTRTNLVDDKRAADEEGVVRLKIYRARQTEGVWGDIQELPFNDNSYSVAHPALSPDGKMLYFASDMNGSKGQSDLWRVQINEDGSFGAPENLGPKINTEARETFPFVTSENILYFSSDGHPGLGGLDVYAIKLPFLPYKGKVLNVGRPVNSEMDDFTYIIDDATHQAYVASNRAGGMGDDDIYSFRELTPLPFDCIQSITGTVRDKITNEVLVGATVRVIDENNNEIGSSITDANGDYEITLDCDQGNFVRASREGYIPSEEYLPASDGKPRIMDFYLEPETVLAGYGDDLAKLLQLSTIYFDFDKWNIRPDAEIEIQKVIAAMEKYPSLKLKVNSHTDSRGPDAYNLWLSQKRADATVAYMISKGIASDRLSGEGFGETRLINGCANGVRCPDADHELNRRSEFIIME